MPFKKQGRYYVSPTGKKFTKKQVMAYYAHEELKKKNTKPKT